MSPEQTKIDSLTLELFSQILPFGSLDVGTCITVLNEAGADVSEFGQYSVDFCNDCDIQLPDVDICYLAFEYILQESRKEIEEKTGVDILNDLEHEVYVYGNYCCTSYDGKDFESTIGAIEKIPNQDRSNLLSWFLERLK